jgi:hypothetical protein
MPTKDISDKQVCEAYKISHAIQLDKYPYEILQNTTGQCEKVCYRAMERACSRGYIECGVSLRTGWLTEKGKALLNK